MRVVEQDRGKFQEQSGVKDRAGFWKMGDRWHDHLQELAQTFQAVQSLDMAVSPRVGRMYGRPPRSEEPLNQPGIESRGA